MLDSQPPVDSQEPTIDRKKSSPSKSSPSPSLSPSKNYSEPSTQLTSTRVSDSRHQNRGAAAEEQEREKGSTGTEKPVGQSVSIPANTTTTRRTTTETTATTSEDEDGTEESHRSKDLLDSTQQDPDEHPDDGPLVDMETFGQLLEMDDDEEHSFSKSLTWDYFDQAVTTFKEMDGAVSGGDLITLSRKGHFLKGSSAALGLNRVKASCEKMQHYGNKKKANGEGTLSESEAMERCKSLLSQLKEEQMLSKAWLERFYAERNV